MPDQSSPLYYISRLQTSLQGSSLSPGGEHTSVIKRIDVKEDEYAFYGKKHVIELKTSPGGKVIFFDGRKVSSGDFSHGELRSVFAIENSGKQEVYMVIIREATDVHLGMQVVGRVETPADIPGKGHSDIETYGSAGVGILPDLKLTRSLKAAVIRDGRIIYNEGLLVPSADLENFRQIIQLRSKGMKFGYCHACDLVVSIPNSRYCPNCGAKTEPIPPGENPTPGQGAAQKLGHQSTRYAHEELCAVCNDNLENGDYVAWCPYCGKPSHKIELIKWLNHRKRCPSCEQQIDGKKMQGLLQINPSSPYTLNASLDIKTEREATRDEDVLDVKRKLLGVCIVCGGKVYRGEEVARCPYCLGLAHRGDLLEWAHVKGHCPSCGKKLD